MLHLSIKILIFYVLDKTMYNRNSTRSSRSGGRAGGSGWKNKSRGAKPQLRGRKFSGEKIDINRFINQAVKISDTPAFVPQYSFNELDIRPELKEAIAKKGYVNPTPIQDLTIPIILTGQDVIGLANTGTGKTGAFLIPLIHKILLDPKQQVLIVTPTRELATQIQEEFFSLAKNLRIHSAAVIGGARMHDQVMQLRKHPNVVIGTPGRLKDLITRKFLDLRFFNNIVLDEADRMLDMGFINDVKLLLSLAAKERQVLLFSATLGKEIENLVDQFLVNPAKISIKCGETSKQVDQNIVRVKSGEDKIDILHNMLMKDEFEKVLIFTRTKHGADNLSKKLYIKGLPSEAIHGNKTHSKRQQVLKKFKDSSINILIATDVAARGLDIPNVSNVINFDVPATYEDYVHRIGRTGRADKNGVALTFIN